MTSVLAAEDSSHMSVSSDLSASSPLKPIKSEQLQFTYVRRRTWAEEIELEEEANMEPPVEIKLEDMEIKVEDVDGRITPKRDIAIEILEPSNEVKYDKLVAERKVKSPFKRHSSGSSLDGSFEPISGEGRDLLLNDPSILEVRVKCEEIAELDALVPPPQSLCFNPKRKMERGDVQEAKRAKGRSMSTTSSHSSGGASSSSGDSSRAQKEYEKDKGVLERRQKQIDYGKNTLGYEIYTEKVPKDQRSKEDPKTPPKRLKYSRRAWDGLIKAWRKKLHAWDIHNQNLEERITTSDYPDAPQSDPEEELDLE